MPFYDHKCPDCGVFEDFRSIKRASKLPSCPKCGHKKCERVWDGTGRGTVKMVGSGDTTTAAYGEDGKPYRFKSGTEKEQRQELREYLNKKEQSVPEKYRRVYEII